MSTPIRDRLKFYALVLLVSFFAALFLYSRSPILLDAFTHKDNQNAFYKGEKGIALTFNITWGKENAETILNVLEKADYRSATFFLSGAWAEKNQHIVKEIVNKKYEIGVLGYDYVDYSEMSEKEIKADMQKALKTFKKLGIPEVSFVRAPTGAFNQETLSAAKKLDLTFVHWSVNTHDWKNPGIKKITKTAATAGAGDILLLHASDSALQTAQALPTIIDHIHEKDLEPLTITEMLTNGKANTKELSLK